MAAIPHAAKANMRSFQAAIYRLAPPKLSTESKNQRIESNLFSVIESHLQICTNWKLGWMLDG